MEKLSPRDRKKYQGMAELDKLRYQHERLRELKKIEMKTRQQHMDTVNQIRSTYVMKESNHNLLCMYTAQMRKLKTYFSVNN